ncbi:unnamed protein product [Polarella glacialis]|uniref:Hcy-binding domain-containing protein n=1 Tax=Polarella glacialis TaxID=89957 RepID=A0A813K6Q4_POLGL|nr:unnamed protein product [Polarella glacialis]CAE8692637.1 unnamed protein product [Polarella glacialis]
MTAEVVGQPCIPVGKDPLAALSRNGRVVVLDGGLATHIESFGEDIDHALWSARCLVVNPDVIRRAHTDYYAAGADVAITASYQAHIPGFQALGVDPAKATDAMKSSVRLAQEGASAVGGATRLVAGSIGPYGASLHNGSEYTGDYPGMDEDKLLEWHRPRAKALVEAGCDILACETVPCMMEARALVRLVEELQHPAWVTFSCRSGSEVCSGERFADCVSAVAACSYVVGAGVNCSDPRFVAELVGTCRENLPVWKHVVVYPNSGEVWCGETHAWKSGTATADEAFVTMARQWVSLGATCVGGCCRTSPATIAALRAAFADNPAVADNTGA